MTIPKTKFIETLEKIHNATDERYGQIINNALQVAMGREAMSARYDTFRITDEAFTEILIKYAKTIGVKL